MNSDVVQQVLFELRKSKEFIEANWKDSIAEQYLIWVEQAENTLKECDEHHEVICSTLCEIESVCKAAIDDNDDETPKTLKKVKTLSK